MQTNSARQAWPVVVSLFATAMLAFSLGVLATAWAVAEAGMAPRGDGVTVPEMASEPTRLRFALVPPVRVAAGEAAVLVPEVFANALPSERSSAEEERDAYTLQLGLFLLPQRAEEARRAAAAKGIVATTRLTIDARGHAWYQVTGGRFADRISAELASRSLLGAYPIADADSRHGRSGRDESGFGGWGRG